MIICSLLSLSIATFLWYCFHHTVMMLFPYHTTAMMNGRAAGNAPPWRLRQDHRRWMMGSSKFRGSQEIPWIFMGIDRKSAEFMGITAETWWDSIGIPLFIRQNGFLTCQRPIQAALPCGHHSPSGGSTRSLVRSGNGLAVVSDVTIPLMWKITSPKVGKSWEICVEFVNSTFFCLWSPFLSLTFPMDFLFYDSIMWFLPEQEIVNQNDFHTKWAWGLPLQLKCRGMETSHFGWGVFTNRFGHS